MCEFEKINCVYIVEIIFNHLNKQEIKYNEI